MFRSAAFYAIKNELVSELCDYISNKIFRRGNFVGRPCVCVYVRAFIARRLYFTSL